MFNTARLLSVDILQKASNLLLLPFFLKFMTQEEYGLYGYLVAIITVLSNYLPINLHIAQSKLYFEFSGEHRQIMLFMSFLILFSICSLVLGPLYLAGVDSDVVSFMVKEGTSYSKLRFFILPALLYASFSMLLNNFMLVSERIRLFQGYNISRLLLINPIALLLMFYLSGDKLIIRFTYTYSIEILLVLVFAVPYFIDMKIGWRTDIFERIKSLCSPYIIGSMVSIIFFLSDRVILDRYRSMADMGVYNLAITIASVIFIVHTSVINAWIPRLFKEQDRATTFIKAKQLIVQLVLIYSIAGALLLGLLYLLLLSGTISKSYNEALLILPFLLLAQIVQSVNSVYSYLFIHFERAVFNVVMLISLCAFSIIAYLFLIPHFGLNGLAIGMLASGALVLSINIIYSNKLGRTHT
jgi:O-antigen/teichoic acid export membrane protein